MSTPSDPKPPQAPEPEPSFELDDYTPPVSEESTPEATVSEVPELDATPEVAMSPQEAAETDANSALKPNPEAPVDLAAYGYGRASGGGVQPARRARFWEYTQSRELWATLGLVVGLGVLVLYLFFEVVLPAITAHNEAVSVPRVVNQPLAQARATLEEAGLAVEVDSQYQPLLPPLTVLVQNPRNHTRVKPGRRVYLIINKKTPPKVALPEVVETDLRQASYLLSNWGLKVGNVSFRPGAAKDQVIAAVHAGEVIKPGTPLVVGSKVDLIVSRGYESYKVKLPDVTEMTLQEAQAILYEKGLSLGALDFRKGTGKPDGYVLMQSPPYGKGTDSVLKGFEVDLVVAGSVSGLQLPGQDFIQPDSTAGDQVERNKNK